MLTDTNQILNERGKTHGDYSDHSRITQAMKRTMYAQANWRLLSDDMRETLEMVAHKIGRVLAGNPNHQDHWDDIAGYAKLVANRLAQDAVTKSWADAETSDQEVTKKAT
jgi:hypothetical protein